MKNFLKRFTFLIKSHDGQKCEWTSLAKFMTQVASCVVHYDVLFGTLLGYLASHVHPGQEGVVGAQGCLLGKQQHGGGAYGPVSLQSTAQPPWWLHICMCVRGWLPLDSQVH